MNDIIMILSKPWLNTKDIQALCHCSGNKAVALKTFVQKKITESGKTVLNKRYVSTAAFVHFLNEETINVAYNVILDNLREEVKKCPKH